MSRVLLTGGTGFIGRHVSEALARRGYGEVHAVSRADGHDLLEPGAAERAVAEVEPTHLLHLAWYAEHGAFWTSPENLRWVEASLALLRAFADAGGERAVLAGTCAEYDWAHGFCSEGVTPLEPATLYGGAKHALHTVAARHAEQAGYELGWGRIFFVHGPHEDPRRLVASVARALTRGEEAPTSEGTQRRDFLHAADLADAFAALLDARGVEGPVNLASGDPVTVREVVDEVARAAGRPELVRAGAVPMRPDDPPLLVADVRRLRDEVGWRPSRTLRQGIEETVGWWKERV
jgi:nucleoside-diphosphate-sugar epimerase